MTVGLKTIRGQFLAILILCEFLHQHLIMIKLDAYSEQGRVHVKVYYIAGIGSKDDKVLSNLYTVNTPLFQRINGLSRGGRPDTKNELGLQVHHKGDKFLSVQDIPDCYYVGK
jgi:hypothetical protein